MFSFRSGRPDRHHGDDVTPVTSDLSQQPPSSVPASVSSTPRLPPPAADDPTSGMGQNATKAPSTGTTGESSYPSPARDVSGDVITTSPLTSSRHGSDAGPVTSPSTFFSSPPPAGLATGSLLPAAGSGTGTPLGASDSSTSTTSSRRGDQRKRYKTRACAEDEEAAASPEVKVRPGKKDKSWVRKSTLNTTIDEENGESMGRVVVMATDPCLYYKPATCVSNQIVPKRSLQLKSSSGGYGF